MPGWQSFQELHSSDDFVFIAIAFDVGGVKDAKPLYDRAKASYITLVDPQNAFGEALGLKVVPNGLFFNEAGALVYRKEGGFEVRSAETIREVEKFLSAPKAEGKPSAKLRSEDDIRADLRLKPDEGRLHLELGRLLLASGRRLEARGSLAKARRLSPQDPAPLAGLAALELAENQPQKAVALLDQALLLDPKNYVIRKQRWLILYPEKFHPTIDWDWQREQMKRETGG